MEEKYGWRKARSTFETLSHPERKDGERRSGWKEIAREPGRMRTDEGRIKTAQPVFENVSKPERS